MKSLKKTINQIPKGRSDMNVHKDTLELDTKYIGEEDVCIICHSDRPLNSRHICKECAEKLAKNEKFTEV